MSTSTFDTKLIFINGIYSITYMVFGALDASLGATIPFLAKEFHKSTAAFGIVFTVRACGFLLGSMLCSTFFHYYPLALSKPFASSLSAMILGISAAVISICGHFETSVAFYGLQGIGFGFVETLVLSGLIDFWGDEAGTYIQAVHALYGVGAIIAPMLIGSLGYQKAYLIIAVYSTVPLLCLFGYLVRMYFCTSSEPSTQLTAETLNDDKYLPQTVDSYDDYKSSSKESQISPQRTLSSTSADSMDELNADVESASKWKKGQQDSFKSVKKGQQLERNNTMNTSFLTVSSTRSERDKMNTTITLKLLGAFFGFLFNGCEAGFGGWVPAYTLHVDVTSHESQAAYLESIFWTATTIGRVCAVPASLYLSSGILIRVALGASLLSGIIMIIFLAHSYLVACLVCGLVGFSLSSIYPFILAIVSEMGYDMDSVTTTYFTTGVILGDAFVPVIIGICMSQFGSLAMPIIIMGGIVGLTLVYLLMHVYMNKASSLFATQSTSRYITKRVVPSVSSCDNLLQSSNSSSSIYSREHDNLHRDYSRSRLNPPMQLIPEDANEDHDYAARKPTDLFVQTTTSLWKTAAPRQQQDSPLPQREVDEAFQEELEYDLDKIIASTIAPKPSSAATSSAKYDSSNMTQPSPRISKHKKIQGSGGGNRGGSGKTSLERPPSWSVRERQVQQRQMMMEMMIHPSSSSAAAGHHALNTPMPIGATAVAPSMTSLSMNTTTYHPAHTKNTHMD